MKISLGCELSYEVAAPSVFIFHIEVARINSHTILAEKLSSDPELKLRDSVAAFDNRYTRLHAPKGPLKVSYEASVELQTHKAADPATIREIPVSRLPLRILPFLLPSRFCESDRLAQFAKQEFGKMPPGHSRVGAICDWIHQHIEYKSRSSSTTTSAQETLIARAGVCRDFAHLGIAFCRGIGIPARFVSCYASGLEPPDFHAVFEAYLGGHWWLFDATRESALDSIVRIGTGRDAAEVSFATIYGDSKPTTMRVWTNPEGADGAHEPVSRERATAAVRTA
jgi:transglutaminase-like putative cysteine protease